MTSLADTVGVDILSNEGMLARTAAFYQELYTVHPEDHE